MAGKTAAMNEQGGSCTGASGAATLRGRIIEATFQAMLEHGFGVSTQRIAALARISKRDLYAVFRSKQEILAACIAERRVGLAEPDLPEPTSAAMLQAVLIGYGTRMLLDLLSPGVTRLTRLAIAEAGQGGEIARALNEHGKQPIIALMQEYLGRAVARGLLAGDAARMTAVYFWLLIGDAQMTVLMDLAAPLTPAEAEQRARLASSAVLRLFAPGAEPGAAA